MKLSVKYVILHKIGITNWHPTFHLSTIFITLANPIYLVKTGAKINIGNLVYQHVLRHVNTFRINILKYFPWLLSVFLLFQHHDIPTESDVASSTPKKLSLSYKLF